MLTTMSFGDEAPYCLDHEDEELSIEERIKNKSEIAEEME